MRTEPSAPFSSGAEYESFIYYFCERCKKGKCKSITAAWNLMR